MKIEYTTGEKRQNSEPKKESGIKRKIDKISTGFNSAEMYIKLGDTVIFLPPSTVKKLKGDLQESVSEWEKKHGKIKLKRMKKKRKESVPKKVLKSLYKSKKIGSKLISINTSRRKHISPKGS